jgi:hypothetical protein
MIVTLRQMEVPPCTHWVHGRLAAAACGSRLDALALANLHGGLVVDSGCSHALLNLSCHRQESLLDVGCVLGRGLEEGNSKAVGKLLEKKKET